MMKVDDVVVIVTLVLCYYNYCLPEEENWSFAFVKDQTQDEMMMVVVVEMELLVLQSSNILF
jgi:hypothetical protein